MSFASDLSAMQAAVYARNGMAATYTPAGGSAQAVTVLAAEPEQAIDLAGLGRKVVDTHVFRLRASEFAALFPGLEPKKGDGLVVADTGESLVVVDKPARRDPRRTEWTLHLAPAA